MVLRGGANVYPAEVENALMSHDGVADVAVIGVPDERWGEAGCEEERQSCAAMAKVDQAKEVVFLKSASANLSSNIRANDKHLLHACSHHAALCTPLDEYSIV